MTKSDVSLGLRAGMLLHFSCSRCRQLQL